MNEWTPTDDQRRALAYAQDRSYGYTLEVLCRDTGLAYDTVCGWWRDPAFAQWWAAATRAWFGARVPQLYGALWKAATKGRAGVAPPVDVQAARLLLERFDRELAPRQRREVRAIPLGVANARPGGCSRADDPRGCVNPCEGASYFVFAGHDGAEWVNALGRGVEIKAQTERGT